MNLPAASVPSVLVRTLLEFNAEPVTLITSDFNLKCFYSEYACNCKPCVRFGQMDKKTLKKRTENIVELIVVGCTLYVHNRDNCGEVVTLGGCRFKLEYIMGVDCGDKAAEWYDKFFGRPGFRLLYFGKKVKHRRLIDQKDDRWFITAKPTDKVTITTQSSNRAYPIKVVLQFFI